MTRDRRIAIVTGGSRGIGAAICQRLAADGLLVNIVYRERGDEAERVQHRIVAAGGEAVLRRADVAVEKDVNRLVDDVIRDHKRINVLINNAGIIQDQLVVLTESAAWERVLRVNLTAPFMMCRAVVPYMLDEGGDGVIINISSTSARVPRAGQAAYAASKGGLESFTRTLAAEVGRKGIRVNTVAPGRIDTEMTASFRAPGRETPEQAGWGTPEDIAGAVSYLVSADAKYVQGELLTVAGGRPMERERAARR